MLREMDAELSELEAGKPGIVTRHRHTHRPRHRHRFSTYAHYYYDKANNKNEE